MNIIKMSTLSLLLLHNFLLILSLLFQNFFEQFLLFSMHLFQLLEFTMAWFTRFIMLMKLWF